MKHLMIDIETMGNKPTAPIVTIGAVFFDPQTGGLGAEFYMAVNLASAMEQGATPDGDTILWWLKQSAEARAAICTDDTKHIADVLSELSSFISRNADNPSYLKVWGNGANFDNVILRSAYDRADQTCPWQFWNDSDVRTMVLLGKELGFDPKRNMPFDGVAHNALADARHQAKIRVCNLAEAYSSHQHRRINLTPGCSRAVWRICHGKTDESESMGKTRIYQRLYSG